MTPLQEKLFSLADESYRAFQLKLLPTVAPETVIGVRTPLLRAMAKDMLKAGEAEEFLSSLPHAYFDENQLHAFLISDTKDFSLSLAQVEAFLPYIDNWATCDQLSPKAFKKRRDALPPVLDGWLSSGETYRMRFALGMLMQHFLDGDFDPCYLEKAAAVRSEEYYVNMMIAWYFATALAKQYEAALPYLAEKRLSPWTHNKAIQKALESYRVPPERKEYLKTLKIPNAR